MKRLLRLADRVRRAGLKTTLKTLEQSLGDVRPTIKLVDTAQGKFYCISNDYLSELLASNEVHEPHFLELTKLLIKPGDNVIDLGANIGAHCIWMARLTNPGIVFAFEPLSLTFSQLQLNAVANGITNIVPYKLAVTDRTGDYLQMEGTNFAADSFNIGITKVAISGGKDGVLSVRLDDLPLPQINFIKIDIQGSECVALRGMRQLIERDRPIIFLEIEELHLRVFNASSKELIETMFARNYTLFRVVTDYPCDHIAVPNEKLDAVESTLREHFKFKIQKLQGKEIELTFADGGSNYTSYIVR